MALGEAEREGRVPLRRHAIAPRFGASTPLGMRSPGGYDGWMSGNENSTPVRSGSRVVIVGAGFAGLNAA